MTKRHFEAFARQLKSDLENAKQFRPAEYVGVLGAATYAASVFANVASSDNPRFDKQRFFAACGLDIK